MRIVHEFALAVVLLTGASVLSAGTRPRRCSGCNDRPGHRRRRRGRSRASGATATSSSYPPMHRAPDVAGQPTGADDRRPGTFVLTPAPATSTTRTGRASTRHARAAAWPRPPVLQLVPHRDHGAGARRRRRHDGRDAGVRDLARRLRGDLGRRRTAAGHRARAADPSSAAGTRPTGSSIGRNVQARTDGSSSRSSACNGPLSDPPANFIWIRHARLELHPWRRRTGRGRAARGQRARRAPRSCASTRSCRRTRSSSSWPRASSSPRARSGSRDRRQLLFSDPNANRIYAYDETAAGPQRVP